MRTVVILRLLWLLVAIVLVGNVALYVFDGHHAANLVASFFIGVCLGSITASLLRASRANR